MPGTQQTPSKHLVGGLGRNQTGLAESGKRKRDHTRGSLCCLPVTTSPENALPASGSLRSDTLRVKTGCGGERPRMAENVYGGRFPGPAWPTNSGELRRGHALCRCLDKTTGTATLSHKPGATNPDRQWLGDQGRTRVHLNGSQRGEGQRDRYCNGFSFRNGGPCPKREKEGLRGPGVRISLTSICGI